MGSREINSKIMRKQRVPVFAPIPHPPLPTPLLIVLCSLFFISCQTAPKIADTMMDETGFVPLKPGASIYLFADIQNAMPILSNLALYKKSDKQIQQMIEKTRFAVAAVHLSAQEGEALKAKQRYQLIAWGSYPASGAKMALGASKSWKKYRSSIIKAEYWHSAEGGLSIAVTPAQVFVAAAAQQGPDTPLDPFFAAPGTEIPEGFNEFRKGAVLSCWINSPSSMLNKKLAETGIPFEIPAEQLFISLFAVDEQTERYEARLRIEAPSAMQARALATLLLRARTFLSFVPSSGDTSNITALLMSVLLANSPVYEGKYITIKTNPLSIEESTLLFNMFSLQ